MVVLVAASISRHKEWTTLLDTGTGDHIKTSNEYLC
jgi:hypothetical protein